MGEEQRTTRGLKRDDDQALEEIRRLFARYRRLARHNVVRERDRDDDDRRPDDRLAGSSRTSAR
jgi:hypothetical protein